MEAPKKLEKAELDKYMPHKGKMFLLSRMTDFDLEKEFIETEFDVEKECIFFEPENDGVPNWMGFELMAQTVSAFTGILNHLKGRPSLPGMILSVSDFNANTEFYKRGSTVRISVLKDFYDAETKIYRYVCTIKEGDCELADAKITVMEVESFNNIVK